MAKSELKILTNRESERIEFFALSSLLISMISLAFAISAYVRTL